MTPGINVISDTSPAATGTVVGSSTFNVDRWESWVIYATLTGATGGVLDVYLQTSFDNGVTWYDVAHFPQLTAGATTKTYQVASAFQVAAAAASVVVGRGTAVTPSVALAADTYTRGPLGSALRAVYVAGASTSAGATQTVQFFGFVSP